VQLRIPGVELQTVIDDDELTAEALAADPNPPLPHDAVSLWELTDSGPRDVLPSWYMPAPMGPRAVHGWRRVLLRGNVGLIIAAFLTITAAGLCNTYGQIHL
jgi:hypothetical protein